MLNASDTARSQLGIPDDELTQIRSPVAAELAEVERWLAGRLSESAAALNEAYRHTLEAGGKRLRPLLVLLAAKSVGEADPEVLRLAVAIEEVHIASMLHDDVVDRSQVRRGQASVQALWDNRIAVLTGDYVAADVYQLLSDCEESRYLQIIARAVVEMCEGEARELTTDNSELTEEEHLEIIRGKTAALVSAAAAVGGCAGGGSPEEISVLESYGHYLGMAFQIGDDLLDLYGNGSQLGKPLGNDLRAGLRTLAVIFASQQPGSDDLRTLLNELGPNSPAEMATQAAELVAQLGGKTYAEDKVAEFARAAVDAIQLLEPSAARSSLVALAEFVRHRAW